MKISVNSYDLAEAVNKVAKACAVKETQGKILEGIKLTAKNDKLILMATDSEISIETEIKCDVTQDGAIVVAGKLFSEYVNKIVGGALCVDIETNPNAKAKIYCGKATFEISTMDAEKFPLIKKDLNENAICVNVEDFKKTIAKTAFCCAVDESRPILKGCLIEVTDRSVLTVAALDGFRMGVRKTKLESFSGEMNSVVVPARALNEMVRLIGAEEKLVKIYMDNNHIMLSTADTIFTARLLNGKFVDYNNLFKSADCTEVIANKAELISALERASILAKTSGNLIGIKLMEDTLYLNAKTDMGNIDEEMSVKKDGKDVSFSLNYKYLLDILKAIDEETVRLCVTDGNRPIYVRPKNATDDSFNYLIMPVRTGR